MVITFSDFAPNLRGLYSVPGPVYIFELKTPIGLTPNLLAPYPRGPLSRVTPGLTVIGGLSFTCGGGTRTSGHTPVPPPPPPRADPATGLAEPTRLKLLKMQTVMRGRQRRSVKGPFYWGSLLGTYGGPSVRREAPTHLPLHAAP